MTPACPENSAHKPESYYISVWLIRRISEDGVTAVAKQILITAERIGRGDDELGAVLMKNFLYSLARSEPRPVAVMLMNGGVRLACEGSASLDDLRLAADAGVAVRVCGTCLDYFGLTESLAVGEIGTMPGAVEAMLSWESDAVTIG